MPRPTSHESHQWDDESYHGSPLYYCQFCRCFEGYPEAQKPCPDRDRILAQRAAQQEADERGEYRRMVEARQRFEYLHAKYGRPHEDRL